MRSSRQLGIVAALLLQLLPTVGDEVITNVMSPIVSYQYPNDLSSEALTNGGVSSPVVSFQYFNALRESGTTLVSPIVSYQYFDWPSDDVVQLLSSPRVSFFYQIGSEPLPLLLQGQVTDTSGAALSGAAVSAAVGLRPVAQTTTSVGGNYSLPSLGAGVYVIKASASGHATSTRVLTLSAGTAVQNFQLALLPTAPSQQNVHRPSTVAFITGPQGSSLKVFDRTQFVPMAAGNMPPPDRMTIVLTHGWILDVFGTPLAGGIDGWPTEMAARLRANGVTAANVNILGWDWKAAATGTFPPENNVPSQGVALGQALQSVLGAGYATNIHFLGHSLGAMVNAAAANYLHGDRTAQQPVSPTPWLPARTHMTLFDHAEISRIASAQVLFDGLTLNFDSPTDVLKYAAQTLQGWKPSMPVRSAWADNYISLVGFYLPNTLNVALQKAEGDAGLLFWQAHSYPMTWYDLSITRPTEAANPLGFKRSYEQAQMPGANLAFPPSTAELPLGDAYHQTPAASDPLALEPLPPQNLFQLIVPLFGNGADAVVQGVIGPIQVLGEVSSEIRNGAEQAGEWITQGFNYAGNAALQGGQTLVNLCDSAVLRLQLRTTPPSSSSPMALRGEARSLDTKDGGGSNSPPMAWLPIQFPASATAMAFDFAVQGDAVDDVLVCGIGETNLFSLEAKYVPTNTFSASRLIDVSAWAGTTNELFFGFMGGTSTNATLQIENIRFYSLARPRLEISVVASVTLLTWPSTAGGYVVETTPTLVSPSWETVSNAPVLSSGRYVLTNSWNDPSRFFRLRAR